MNLSYMTVTEVTDYGPYITKIILPLSQSIKSEALSEDTFNVYVERRNKKTGEVLQLRKDWNSVELFPSKGYCRVLKAYTSDSEGNKTEIGSHATLELECEAIHRLNSEIAYVQEHNVYVFCDFRITQVKEIQADSASISGLVYDHFSGGRMEQVKGWVNSESSYAEMPLRFGYYSPNMNSGKRPLIIWLHGAGEGGIDTAIAYTGNNVVNLSSEKVQSLFGGAYVLAPQVPTMWMDDGCGLYTESGQSKYVTALKALIDEFVNNHSNIDTNRIYIGGCSNGGFMTMRMIIDYPGFFAAAYPVCEALYDKVITDQNIQDIKNTPIWFTHSKNDEIVKPEITVIPTYERLLKAGAPNVHFSYFDNVVDTSGIFKDSEGNPFEFFGHGTWIYMLKDECVLDYGGSPVKVNGKEVTLLQWLALQSNQITDQNRKYAESNQGGVR
ncbi:prolyl oligopeptidase family serine peptidase [Neobacillus drentensis]|uniref:prolyl oligopeptidase family serine peptidase n=1 Tax=Neobacillus drentensis TaxID=220684 RepID=UPI001F2FCE04|nr:prolyl oligopeptidase family serine peptidase [Neobacillus drentensis]ULT58310.1 prolyl oligopeptidase family serine peptidase [Neobacillus drentensis]